MSSRTQENIVAVVVLIFFTGYLLTTLTLGPNARLVPLPIATLGIALLAIQLVRQNLTDAKELHVDLFASLTGRAIPEAAPPSETEAATQPGEQFRRELRAGLFVSVFVALILLLGPIVAVCLFSTGFFVLTRHYGPGKALVVGLSFTAVLYLLFVVALQLQLYHGILAPLFE